MQFSSSYDVPTILAGRICSVYLQSAFSHLDILIFQWKSSTKIKELNSFSNEIFFIHLLDISVEFVYEKQRTEFRWRRNISPSSTFIHQLYSHFVEIFTGIFFASCRTGIYLRSNLQGCFYNRMFGEEKSSVGWL